MHQLIWSIHHVVIDGWCLSVLLHEVLDIYESIRRGTRAALKPTRPFRDYVAWLRDRDDAEAEGLLAAGSERRHSGDAARARGHLVARPRPRSRRKFAERETALRPRCTARLQALGRVAAAHAQHPDPGRLGSSAVAVQRPGRRRLRRHGLRSAARAAGRRIDGRHVHQLATAPRRGDRSGFTWSRGSPSSRRPWSSCGGSRRSRSRVSRPGANVPAGAPLFESIVIVQNLPFVASLQERADRLGIESARYLERTHYPAHRHRPAGHRAA